jgi:hypothetical protein
MKAMQGIYLYCCFSVVLLCVFAQTYAYHMLFEQMSLIWQEFFDRSSFEDWDEDEKVAVFLVIEMGSTPNGQHLRDQYQNLKVTQNALVYHYPSFC